ncbi:MAG: LPS export ABC transporter ATP-binding protein [Planctomycetes bacterium]|nr:LPS export ABC transporter ATP-binding protein [Planctomycetota bacterium]
MPLLEVRGLVKIYGRRRVVDGVDFEVNAGEVVGLLGPNGAGKTTSFRMATGQITPNAGTVYFNGENVTKLPMYQRARLGMGYLSQETSVFRKLTVEQNILAILELMPALRTLGRPLTRKERWERTDAVLNQFGLTRVRHNTAARLSGGEKRRLEIARCLVCEPLLILLDEPFTGIDPITIADIREIVRQLRDSGIGLLLTDHNVHEALKITSRSYLIKDGKVRTHGTPSQIVRDPIAISEYLGKEFNDRGIEDHVDSHRASAHVNPPARVKPEQPAAPTPKTPGATVPRTLDFASAAPVAAGKPANPALAAVLEQEKVLRLIEGLKTPDYIHAAAELVHRGQFAIPALLAALERRDVEMRRQVKQVLESILKGTLAFDPYAPEAQRRLQLAQLRDQWERKAG